MKQRLVNSSFLFIVFLLLLSCKDSASEIILSTLTPQLSVSNITATTAEYGATITDDKGQTVTVRGICWSTNISPTIKDSVKNSGSGIGAFSIQMKNLRPKTSYYVRAFATNSTGTSYGGAVNFVTSNLSSVTTTSISNITSVGAKSGGVITIDKGISVISRGVCWSTAQNPTVDLSTKTNDGTGIDSYTSLITPLLPITTYYVRAYLTTVDGTVYGKQETFSTVSAPPLTGTVSDIDGNLYHYITIGSQAWMVENLKTTKYSNGDLIGTTSSLYTDLSYAVNPKYQWSYNGDESNVATYGRLYTWYTVTDSRGIAPNGWHVASDAEWASLQNYLIANGYNYDKTTSENKIAKSLCTTTLWNTSYNVGAPGNDLTKNNSSGFSMVAGGYRGVDGSYYILKSGTDIWTSTEASPYYGCARGCGWQDFNLGANNLSKNYGFSVRCVRD